MPSATGVVHEAGVPRRPSISTRHSRHDPNASSRSVAHSLGMSTPASAAARMTEVPSGTETGSPSTSSEMVAAPVLRRSAEVGFLEQTHGVPSILAIGCPARKSSGKWAMALRTGIGVSPPIAHRRSLGHHVTEVLEQSQVLVAVLARGDPVDHFHAAHRTDPARCALAARLRGAELHRKPGLCGHVHGFVEHHDAAVADHRTRRSECLVVHRQVELRPREVCPERAAHLHRTHRPPRPRAAAVAVHEFAERDPESRLHDAALLDVPAELKHLCAA